MSKLLNIGNELLIFDGAMGTMLQEYGMKPGENPELLNLKEPALIQKIHSEYLEAGADIITANTFGANAYKLSGSGFTVEEVIKASICNAKAAIGNKKAFVALDLGPIGKMMKPIGMLDFDEAYEFFKEEVVAGAAAGADLIIIETMSDLGEMRAAVLAAKENSDLPVIATMTFAEDGRTLTGTDPEIMVLSMEALGVDALGVNCSLGPKELGPIVTRILSFSNTPVIVQANAGIPVSIKGRTKFSITPKDFSEFAKEMVKAGVSIIGGCCGTTPEFIKELDSLRSNFVRPLLLKRKRYVCSSQKKVCLDEKFSVIGERINPSGNKALKEQFLAGNNQAAVKEAFNQVQRGAEILDINTSLPQIDELKVMLDIIDSFNGLIETPLQFDSTKPEVLEKALRRYSGVAIVNSINGKKESMESLFPIVKKYGAYVVVLCFDENGIPDDAQGRIDVANKLMEKAKQYGLDQSRLLVDCLVLTASAQQKAVMETLKALRYIKEHTEALTTLGLSNVSYGLPFRALINRTYLAMALATGLDTVIINPGAEGIKDTIMAFNVLANKDQGAVEYIAYNNGKDNAEPSKIALTEGPKTIQACLLEGSKEGILAITKELLEDNVPLSVVDNYLVPALDEIGQMYEKKSIFLPQLIRAAETVGTAFELIRKKLRDSSETMESKGTIVLATVRGDIHDIGKNLVKVLLENYGYEIIDLGKDVPVERIVEIVKEKKIKLVGLSALMTTTVSSMQGTIEALRKETQENGMPPVKIFVGGAVLTEAYALSIGADFFCKDARAGVKVAGDVFSAKEIK
jgi:5-methyltetrahydrofolate--homocysteine methyltransferase